MLTIHHLQHSQSFRIVWLLEELNIPYELKIYPRDPITNLAPTEYKALHPAGTAPVITDGNIVLAETNAIFDYILDQYEQTPRLRPSKENPARVPYLYWFNAGQGSLMPMLLMVFIINKMTEKSPESIQEEVKKLTQDNMNGFSIPRIQALLKLMDEQLLEQDYLAGETLTAADIVLSFELQMLKNMSFINLQQSYPHILNYIKHIESLPSFQRAIEKSGDFQSVLTK